MSWAATLKIKDRDLVNHEETAALVSTLSPEHALQMATTLLNVIDTIESGCLGAPGAEYTVTVSGHANEKFEKTPGWSNNHLTISISQV